MLHGATRRLRGIHKVTRGYGRLHGVTLCYHCLQRFTRVTVGYKRLQWVTRGYGGLHEVLTLRSFLKNISFMKKFPQ